MSRQFHVWEQSTERWREHVGERDAASIMDWPATDDFHVKQGRSTCRVVLGGGKLPIYLKRHWQFPWHQRLLARSRPGGNWSPARTEWDNLHWAIRQGFAVPEPLAAGQMIGPNGRMSSYLAIGELTGMTALHQAIPRAFAIMPAAIFARWKGLVIGQMADISRRLHQLHCYHKDLYLCHFYIRAPEPGEWEPGTLSLIDLHRLSRHRLLGWRWRIKDMAQLLFSTWGVAGFSEEDRSRLMHDYLEAARLNVWQRAWRGMVMNKARRYARHNGAAETEFRHGRAA